MDTSFKPPMNVVKNYAQHHFRSHFQALLYDVLPSPTFHDHLKEYFKSTLPPLAPFSGRPEDLASMSNTNIEFVLPNRYLYKIGILPRYASMLADVAYERLGRIVRGDWDDSDPSPVIESGAGDEGDESMQVDDDGEDQWTERVLDGLRMVVKRDLLSWLYGYLEG
jgi:hypothetical protein